MEQDFSQHTMRNISVVSRKFRAVLNRKVKKYGLNHKTIQLLRHIKRNPGITQTQLCENIKKDKSAITRGVSHLESTNLITKIIDDKDKRIFRLYISEQGENILPILNELHQEMTLAALEGLEEKAIELVNKTLFKIENNIKKHVQEIEKSK